MTDLFTISNACGRGVVELEEYWDELREEADDLQTIDRDAAREVARIADHFAAAIQHLRMARDDAHHLAVGRRQAR